MSFEWPAAERGVITPTESTRNGYHVIHWDRGGLDFWMVSNLNEAEMNQLATMLRETHRWRAASGAEQSTRIARGREAAREDAFDLRDAESQMGR